MKQATCKQTLHLMHFVLDLPGYAAHRSCLGTSVTKWSVLSYLASAGTLTIRAAGLPVEPVFLALAYCMYVLAMLLWNSRRSSCSTRAADEFLYRSQAFCIHTHLESTQRKATTTFLYGCTIDSIGCYIQIKSIYPSRALVFLCEAWLIGHYSPSFRCWPSNCLGNWIYPKAVWGYYNHTIAIPSSN